MLRTSNGSANRHHGLDRLRDYSIASPVPLLSPRDISRRGSHSVVFGAKWTSASGLQNGFMMGWTPPPPDGIGVPKVEVLSTT
jgi:hypothetical protein